MANDIINKPIISSDSHVMEPPDTYITRIDHKYKDTAPRVVWQEKGGDTYVIEGMKQTIPMGLVAAAGVSAEGLATSARFAKFEDLHRGGWDPEARMAEQDRDGVYAEVIYPSVGMILCNHPDPDYKKACFDAYNLWITEFQSTDPARLIGLGQTALRSVDEGIADLVRIKEFGLHGVMMPGYASCVSGPMQGGRHIGPIARTTRTTGTATGSPPRSTGCRASTSSRTSTSRFRTIGSRSRLGI